GRACDSPKYRENRHQCGSPRRPGLQAAQPGCPERGGRRPGKKSLVPEPRPAILFVRTENGRHMRAVRQFESGAGYDVKGTHVSEIPSVRVPVVEPVPFSVVEMSCDSMRE